MHLTVYTFRDMSSSPSDLLGAYILFYLATDDFIFLKDLVPTTTVSYLAIPNTRDTCFLLSVYMLSRLVARSLVIERQYLRYM